MVDTLIAHLFVVFFSKSLLPGQQCHSSACCLFVPSVYCVKKQMLLECFAYVYSNFTLCELMTLLQSFLLLNMLICTVHCKNGIGVLCLCLLKFHTFWINGSIAVMFLLNLHVIVNHWKCHALIKEKVSTEWLFPSLLSLLLTTPCITLYINIFGP
jgi:hypothetical protein